LSAPRSVAIITDGNGRWAAARGLPVEAGHEAGADNVKARLRDAVEFGISELTVFSFSTENWGRPEAEVRALMEMFDRRIQKETPELDAEGVRMRFIGRRQGVEASLIERMAWAQEKTAGNDRIDLFIAFNYGGRAEILDAAKTFAGDTEEEFRRHHKDERGAEDVQLPALADRLLRAGIQGRALARLRSRRLCGVTRGVRRSTASFRREAVK
jgi:undecaprenyl diphosphate synthase